MTICVLGPGDERVIPDVPPGSDDFEANEDNVIRHSGNMRDSRLLAVSIFRGQHFVQSTCPDLDGSLFTRHLPPWYILTSLSLSLSLSYCACLSVANISLTWISLQPPLQTSMMLSRS
eukprot:TRINITY_DN3333_c1_g3_i1.p1 TRINITY_DN3333_c1_g3~~TRINITY_DN3333_c1_g3_i1.p1  ORF type:complete len:118 (-),score=9.63 TRINITY_DN3333_c1_g3_i1:196-549(-)